MALSERRDKVMESAPGAMTLLKDRLALPVRDVAALLGISTAAVRSYGGQTAATIDFDVLIDPKLLKETTTFLEAQGGTLASSVESTTTFHMKPVGIHLDVRVAKSPLDQAALAGAKPASFQDRKLKIVLPGELTAMKVKAYSERKDTSPGKVDRTDVLGMLKVGATTEHEVRRILKRYRPDLLAEMDEILST